MAQVFVLMAQGFEEMEFTITVDVLRRAGIDVKCVTLNAGLDPVMGSRGIKMVPEITFEQIDEKQCDMLILPGGVEGTERLGKDERVLALVKRLADRGQRLAAICAAPAVFVKAGVVQGRRVTSHPAVEKLMTGVLYQTHRVVVDGPFVTSRSAGTTFEFAFALVEMLAGKEKVKDVNKGVLALLPDALPELMM